MDNEIGNKAFGTNLNGRKVRSRLTREYESQHESMRETLMPVFLVDRAQSTVNRKGVPEARDIGKYVFEYRYIIFGPVENER